MVIFNDIYETMLGFREKGFQVPGVENAFYEDSECALDYELVRLAYRRICFELGVEESPDLDEMMESMERIQWELCRRCYFLGKQHGSKHPL